MRSISLRQWCFAAGSALLQLIPFPVAGPVPLWRRAFCWFCLVPLLAAFLDKDRKGRPLTAKQTAALGYLCGVVWYIGNCYWIYQTMYLYGGLPKPVALGILFLFSLYLGLYQALFGWLFGAVQARAGSLVGLFAVPFLWVGVELARARITGFPWDLLGYTQVDNEVLTALAPVAGVMALSFVIAAVCALLAAAYAFRGQARWKLAAGAIVLAIVLQAGVLYHPAADAATRSATLLQENLAVGAQGKEAPLLSVAEKYHQFVSLSKAPETFATHSNIAPASTSSGREPKDDFIVWPEAPADFATSDPVFRANVSGLARETGTTVISGSVGIDFDAHAEGGYHEFGSAAVFDKHGVYLGRYDKIHRVPWGEYVPYKELFFFAGQLVAGVGRMEPGTQHTLFQSDGHSFGIFICYESIFGDEVREFTKNGANVLINISDDGWYGDTGAPWQHLDMERMRAIENRRWILRDTNTGVTTAVDTHGRGIFSTPRHVRAAFRFLFDYRSDTTFYTRHGDWFAWLCAAVSAAMLVFSFARGSSGRGSSGRGEVH